MRRLTDARSSAGKIHDLRAKLDAGARPDDLLIEAFAAAREGMDRGVGIRSIFNPEFAFDPSQLKDPAGDAGPLRPTEGGDGPGTPPAPPTGEWAGHTEMIPGWAQVDIPPELYEAVRKLYPEKPASLPGEALRRAVDRRHGAHAGQDRRDADGRGQDDRGSVGDVPRRCERMRCTW
jgi:hypothetical protein